MSNLPDWPGAEVCYSRAYRLLEAMARNGHATAPDTTRKGRVIHPGWTSDEMRDLIDALNKGGEERIKAALLYSDRLYGIPLVV